MGLLFLVPGVVAEPLPPEFANPAAYGDLAAGALAILARGGWRAALPLVWLFNVVGTVDLLYAVFRGLSVDAQQNMGAAWYIPTFVVSRPAGDALHGVRPAAACKVGRGAPSIFPKGAADRATYGPAGRPRPLGVGPTPTASDRPAWSGSTP